MVAAHTHDASLATMGADTVPELRALEERVAELERQLRADHEQLPPAVQELRAQVDAFRHKLETTEALSWLGNSNKKTFLYSPSLPHFSQYKIISIFATGSTHILIYSLFPFVVCNSDLVAISWETPPKPLTSNFLIFTALKTNYLICVYKFLQFITKIKFPN